MCTHLSFHRLLGGDSERAMHDASMYVTYASGPGAPQVQLFLLQRFEPVILVNGREHLVTNGLVLWHSTRTRAYSELNEESKAKTAAQRLHKILLKAEADQLFSGASRNAAVGVAVVAAPCSQDR